MDEQRGSTVGADGHGRRFWPWIQPRDPGMGSDLGCGNGTAACAATATGGMEEARTSAMAAVSTRMAHFAGPSKRGSFRVGVPPIQRAIHDCTSQFQWSEFWGERIQWFSSG